jgi:hypothetical protein
MTAPTARFVLFAASCAALLAVALGGEGGARRRPPEAVAERTSPARERAELRDDIAPAARAFLAAYLRYEVGDRSARTRASLRAHATGRFAGYLLAATPRAPVSILRRARIVALHVVPVSLFPPRAAVTGSATRPAGPEQLSFLFECRSGRWLAAAAGQ